jgi:WD40 repeat protein
MDTPVRTITNETFIRSAATSSDRAVIGSELNSANAGVNIFDLNSGQTVQTLTGQGSDGIHSVAISPDGRLAVASTDGKRAVLWNANAGSPVNSAPGPAVGSDNNGRVAFSHDGQVILSSFFGDLTVFDAGLRQKSQFRIHLDQSAFAIAPSPEGSLIAAGYVRFDRGNDLVVFDLLTGQPTRRFVTNPGFGVTCVAWTGSTIFTGSGAGTISLLDAQSGAPVRPFPKHSRPVNAISVSSDGRLALSGSDDTTMKVMEVATGHELRSFNHADGQVVGVGFANNSKSAVSCGGRSLKVWDLTGL